MKCMNVPPTTPFKQLKGSERLEICDIQEIAVMIPYPLIEFSRILEVKQIFFLSFKCGRNFTTCLDP